MSKDTTIRVVTIGDVNNKEALIKALHRIETFVTKDFHSNNIYKNQLMIDFIDSN